MKKIKLKKLELKAFKGIHHLEFELSDETTIKGGNGTGKTTIFDGFVWLLFGKDSTDKKDFSIKTLDEQGNAIPKIDHEVEGTFDIDGREVVIRRVYSEKWVKQRGALESTFEGHETTYYWDGVPLRLKDFNDKVKEICDEKIFKLITSPTAFASLSWQDRRRVLIEVAGEVTNEDVAKGNPEFLTLIEKLKNYDSEEDYKKMINASVKKSREDIKEIPSRIDEAEKSKPSNIDFKGLKTELATQNKYLKDVEDKIENSTKSFQAEYDKINAHNGKINQLKINIDNLRNDLKREAIQNAKVDTSVIDDLNSKVALLESKLKPVKNNLQYSNSALEIAKSKVENIKLEIEQTREKWKSLNAETLNDTDCPTCQRPLEQDKIDELDRTFHDQKTEKLNSINNYGKALKADLESTLKSVEFNSMEVEKTKAEIKDIESEIEKVKKEIEVENAKPKDEVDSEKLYSNLVSNNKELGKMEIELTDLMANRPEEPKFDNSELKNEASLLKEKIKEIEIELSKESQIGKLNERIEELIEQEKVLSQKIADAEKKIFVVDNFNKMKMDLIESKVQRLFRFVSFRMFKEQINGGLEEVCDIMVNGVPYPDANTASKINAGIDIINALSTFHNVSAPIFLDNRESVTEILETESQIINLVVSPKDKELVIINKI